ncbi:hypothetical protein QR680_017317 [Steinernema hermaphroditum]|uniref:CTCHY-type domain-containing protein n=1 Tax=Steinernema hermaphroditum TaxID=289476 RepID=A0AA39HEN5_9BILA|nr:hypothetical protein QR680_017317 [Steinernema hermaphroditum]
MVKTMSKYAPRKEHPTKNAVIFRKKKQTEHKKKESENPRSSALRQRGFFDLLDTEEFISVPSCPHGPCLLFAERNSRKRRWFACAVYRSVEGCNFRVDVRTDGSLPKFAVPQPLTFDYRYGECAKQFEHLKKFHHYVFYCQNCEECVSKVDHPTTHTLRGPLNDLAHPSQILSPVSVDEGEAQYWFSDDSIKVITNALTENEVDGVICVGAPCVFEHLGSSTMRRFMLDIDHRFARFFSTTEFAHYSLLVNHFLEIDGYERLAGFLNGLKRAAIVCDPPFGAFMKAILTSLKKLRMDFAKSVEMHNIIAVPIFVGKHLERDGYDMVDYTVKAIEAGLLF